MDPMAECMERKEQKEKEEEEVDSIDKVGMLENQEEESIDNKEMEKVVVEAHRDYMMEEERESVVEVGAAMSIIKMRRSSEWPFKEFEPSCSLMN